MKITVGADPEMFLKSGDKFISAVGRIGGSKEAPMPMGRDGFFVQEDNVAVEFNIPPAESLREFVGSISWGMKRISDVLATAKQSVVPVASHIFDPEELIDPRASEFGCTPDFNAWTGKMNPRPQCDNPRLRSCGGHIHVGWANPNDAERLAMIRAMDLYHGIPSVLLDPDTARRALYGKAGCYRPTQYGVEYRTLSNFWLKSQALMEWAYQQTLRAAEIIQEPKNWERIFELRNIIEECINTSNRKMAGELCAHYKLEANVT